MYAYKQLLQENNFSMLVQDRSHTCVIVIHIINDNIIMWSMNLYTILKIYILRPSNIIDIFDKSVIYVIQVMAARLMVPKKSLPLTLNASLAVKLHTTNCARMM